MVGCKPSASQSHEEFKAVRPSKSPSLSFQAGERVIRSQFACTYRDDGLPLNRVLDFPSTSQMPTCVHPAPKRPSPPPARPEEEPDNGRVTIGKLSNRLQRQDGSFIMTLMHIL